MILNYRIAIVMTHAGANDAQLAIMRRELLSRMQVTRNIKVVVPSVHQRADRAAMEDTEKLATKLAKVLPRDIECLEVGPILHLWQELKDFDEVWCLTAEGQSERRTRPMRLHAMAQLKPEIGRRFKVIHWWQESPKGVESATSNKKPMKGW